MSEKKRAWWAFWKKKPKAPPDQIDNPGNPRSDALETQMVRSPRAAKPSQEYTHDAQSQFERDPDGTVDLFAQDVDGIDGDTLNLDKAQAAKVTNEMQVPQRQQRQNTAPAPVLSDEERAARVQAARERAARHKGRFGVGVPSSDALPAVSQEILEELAPASPEPPGTPAASTASPAPEEGTHPAPGALFAGCLSLLTVSLSLPLWLTQWPPMRDVPGHLGIIAAFQHLQSNASATSLYIFSPSFYAGSGGDYLLALIGAIFPLPSLIPLLLQCYLLASLFGMLYLLLVAECSLWSACVGLMLLFNGAFFEGNLSFLMATPWLFVGLAFLLQWMGHGRKWAAVATTAVAWGLLFLDPTAYTLFLAAAFCCAFLYATTMSSLLIKMLLPASSLLLFLPWLIVIGNAKAAAFGASSTAATLSWSPYSERITGLVGRLGWPLDSDAGAIAVAGIVLLLSCGVVLHLMSTRTNQSKHLRAFFPTLTLLWLVVYLLFPVRWRGTPITGSAILAFVAFSLMGWLHIDLRRTAGKLLLTFALLWGLVVASILTVTVLRHKQRTKPLMLMLEQVPPNSRLLVWKLPGARGNELSQAGGYYMAMAPGNQSNLDLRGHLRWKFIHYRTPGQVPPATVTQQPNLRNWDYLLTSWQPPDKQRLFFRLIRKYGEYRLYRIQVP